jgi:hypothetical protein
MRLQLRRQRPLFRSRAAALLVVVAATTAVVAAANLPRPSAPHRALPPRGERISRRIEAKVTRRLEGKARIELHVVAGATKTPHPLLMTLGGPIYCVQLADVARLLDASLACSDYIQNGYEMPGERGKRREDWGDPSYLASVARLPRELRQDGVKISMLLLVGVSYSGYANAELVASHPELQPNALIVIDSYLDLAARYRATPKRHPTRKEMQSVIGGTLNERPHAYAARSPSHHLDGLAAAIRNGMTFIDVWSVNPAERRELRGATCSAAANAEWLRDLSGLLDRPTVAYVTHLRHAHALWNRAPAVLALAGIGTPKHRLAARRFTFADGVPLPRGSYCK